MPKRFKELRGKSLVIFSNTPGLTSANNCDLVNQLCLMGTEAAFELSKAQERPCPPRGWIKATEPAPTYCTTSVCRNYFNITAPLCQPYSASRQPKRHTKYTLRPFLCFAACLVCRREHVFFHPRGDPACKTLKTLISFILSIQMCRCCAGGFSESSPHPQWPC